MGDAENAGVENAARSKLQGEENAGVEISGGRLFDRMKNVIHRHCYTLVIGLSCPITYCRV